MWDTHAQNADRLQDVLCPQFDVTFTALLEDLQARGLLDETLVVAIGEFGRTPRDQRPGGPRSLGQRLQLRDGRRGDRGRPGLRLQRSQRCLSGDRPDPPARPDGHDLPPAGDRPPRRSSATSWTARSRSRAASHCTRSSGPRRPRPRAASRAATCRSSRPTTRACCSTPTSPRDGPCSPSRRHCARRAGAAGRSGTEADGNGLVVQAMDAPRRHVALGPGPDATIAAGARAILAQEIRVGAGRRVHLHGQGERRRSHAGAFRAGLPRRLGLPAGALPVRRRPRKTRARSRSWLR